jgi:hypothetical protein
LSLLEVLFLTVTSMLVWMGNRIWANLGAIYGLDRNTNDREVHFVPGVSSKWMNDLS